MSDNYILGTWESDFGDSFTLLKPMQPNATVELEVDFADTPGIQRIGLTKEQLLKMAEAVTAALAYYNERDCRKEKKNVR